MWVPPFSGGWPSLTCVPCSRSRVRYMCFIVSFSTPIFILVCCYGINFGCVCSCILHVFGIDFSNMFLALLCHWFCIDVGMILHRFSSILSTNIAPLPNLANPIFEQQYCVFRPKSCFSFHKKTVFVQIFTSSLLHFFVLLLNELLPWF
jgi:hypothetical protein